ncbi:carbohydrate binding domain-containing protein [Flavobacteriaceae bacterium]|nr:carbohydrate binding domain-containing protein [Flavobacteriaceae bacterium]MDB2418151.1 carbohydrate binding domain-containing protein [Flavobacteriaceae bacterium]
MKKIRTFYKALLILIVISSCKDETNLEFLNDVALPSNIGVNFIVTQDNTGLVTITPFAEGATSFDIDFGDGSESENFANGESTQHVYPEGNYTVGVVATNLIGESAEITQELVISFQAPRNLEVSIENDVAVSRKVNITATAEFAATFEFYSGEDGIVQPVATGNIGDEISYDYAAPGIYAVKVVAKGGAIETTEYTEDFEVTEILAPITRAPSPPGRSPEDVISMYSDQYQQTTVDSYTTSWSVVALQEEVAIEGNQTLVYRDLAYAGIITEAAPINAAAMEMVHFDVWSTNVNAFKIKFVDFNGTGYNGGTDNIEFEVSNTIDQEGEWVSFDLPLSDFTDVPFSDINQTVISADPVGTVFIDNLYFYKAASGPSFDDGLLTNGDFENGSDSWIVGVDDSAPATVVTTNGNTYYSVNVEAAGNVYDVNVSQKVALAEGSSYTLTFDAWSDTNRSIVAGIGLSGPPWTNTGAPLDITSSRTTFSFTYSSIGFGASDARVLFDIGGEVGLVNIDNVSLIVGSGNLLTNGNFENGSDAWIVGVDDSSPAPVVTDSGNTYYSVNVEAAGNVYDVNLSQKVEIIGGNTYTLTFDAWSDRDRTIVAGIGLSGPPWTNTGAPLDITTTRTTYTFTYTDVGFEATDARVLFDIGGEIGLVNIDDVTLSLN